jgi:ubiquinone/menaquinone biosynthesis C-methylase UbiE
MKDTRKWSGERLETFIHNENAIEHLHRYALASTYVKDKIVLDIASGEGYGSNLLSVHAAKVTGVDIDAASVKRAMDVYKKNNLQFKEGSADAIPLADSSVDVIVSFETLEHHDKHEEMFSEIRRVLKQDGLLIMSTPEKRFYTDEKKYNNPYHVKELYLAEFKTLVSKYFVNARFYYQNLFNGSLLVPEISGVGEFQSYSGSYEALNLKIPFNPMYVLTIATNSNNTFIPAGVNIFCSQELGNKQEYDAAKKIREEATDWIKKSLPYRIGNAILKPFKLFKFE